ncbi:MAG: hypothetical protein LC799_10890, partial [Actinobacteria bacterium]|nr:hypothetical protein [Actinomycetota bacterium]
ITLSYGQGYYASQTEAGRASVGVLRGTGSLGLNQCFDDRWFLAIHPAIQGDSGSPVITGDGKALGVMTYVQTIWGGTLAGMTVQALLAEYQANGFPTLELVTAPLTDAAQEVVRTAQHCQDDPLGPYQSQACVRTEVCLPVDPDVPGELRWYCKDLTP